MLVFRIICAVLLAWAINAGLSRPEASSLLQEVPEMLTFLPLAAALVGYFNLAVRQGWGFIVAFANGVWAGVLSIVGASVLYLAAVLVRDIRENSIKDFDQFLQRLSSTSEPLIEQLLNLPLMIVLLGATAVVGVVTEVLHWVLVRFRQRKGGHRTNM